MNRVGSSQDRSPSIQGGVNTSLGNRDGLLLHSLVNGGLILDVHLVELIDAADSVVGEHEGSSFDAELTCFRVFTNGGGETSS